jgi:hypothetical protein
MAPVRTAAPPRAATAANAPMAAVACHLCAAPEDALNSYGLHARWPSILSRAKPTLVTRRMSASAPASAAEPAEVIWYGRRRSGSYARRSSWPRADAPGAPAFDRRAARC